MRKRFKVFRNLLVLVLIIFLTFVIAFSGCKKQEVEEIPEEELTEEKIEKADDVAAEVEEAVEDEAEEIADLEITGNINILSGIDISDGVNNSRPIAIMVENAPDSRPQSGLHLADVIFEVVDEYGVTRFVVIYSSHDAEIVGPVRSARRYYAEIARSFDPIYVFFGTYPECYKIIEDMGLDVLSAIGDTSGNSSITGQASYWRDWERSSVQEHTALMSTLKLKEDAKRVGFSLEGGNSPFRFKLDANESERGTISDINIDFSTTVYSPSGYDVNFKYDKNENNYLRYMGGSPHKDRESGEQIKVKNVIVMITDIEGPIDAANHMAVRTTGTSDIGKAYFFMDGKVIEGTWGRSSIFDPFTYKDKDGNIILFNRNSIEQSPSVTTWVAMVDGVDKLEYK